MDFNGNFEPIKIMQVDDIHSRTGTTFVEGDMIGDTQEEKKAKNTIIGGGNTVPFAIKAQIKVGIDKLARNTITNKHKTTVDAWISEVFTHFQAHYHHPTLRHRINFEVKKF